MDVTIRPGPLSGTVEAISSKSDAHRALICASLADRETAVLVNQTSKDILATAACLTAMGAGIDVCDGRLRVVPIGSPARSPVLRCGESGSTLRFLLPVAAVLGCDALFTGEGRLPLRPLSPFLKELTAHGCAFDSERLPLTLRGRLAGGVYRLAGNISSQYVTGLLFSLPLADKDSEIILTSPLESSGYVDMTLDTLSQFGVRAHKSRQGFSIPGGRRCISPGEYAVEGDWSNAAFWLCAGALGAQVSVSGLHAGSLQGDRRIAGLLDRFGAAVFLRDGAVCVQPRPLSAIDVDAREIPDLVPVLAVTAAGARGDTALRGVGRLRLKESDRLQTVRALLLSLGGDAEILEDTLVVHGRGRLRGGVVDSANDHRIAMAAAVASVLCEDGVVIKNAQAVDKSYPRFFCDFVKLGGTVHVV